MRHGLSVITLTGIFIGCGRPGGTGDGSAPPAADGCSDLDGDGRGAGRDCLGSDCDDTNSAVWDEAACEALCAVDPQSTGCDCNLEQFPAPEACFLGPPEALGQGECRSGLRHCDESGRWSGYDGQVLPRAEVCDALDNDCDSRVDDDLPLDPCGSCSGACQESCIGEGDGCEPFDVAAEGLNVEDCPGVPDCVTLGGRTDPLPVLWAVSSLEGTISHIDTSTRTEVGRYYTSPWGATASPSRTSVDYRGDLVVGNRHFDGVGSATKIAAHDCPAGATSSG